MKIERPLRGRTVLFLLLGFFGLIAAVDGLFIVLAERSFPGYSAHAYERGLAYNRVLAAADAQRALGWQVALSVDHGALVLHLRDRNGEPVRSPTVLADIQRPAEARDDRSIPLIEVGPGVYRADGAFSTAGNWEVSVRIRRDDGPDYRIEQRVVSP